MMESIRVALLAAGALVALVGGAETASWGLTPLTESLNATAPQLVASDASPVENSTPATDLTIGPSSAAPAAIDTTSISYKPVLPIPADGDSDGPRRDNNIQADAPAATLSSLDASPGRDSYDAERSPDASTAAAGSSARDTGEGDATATADGAARMASASIGPD